MLRTQVDPGSHVVGRKAYSVGELRGGLLMLPRLREFLRRDECLERLLGRRVEQLLRRYQLSRGARLFACRYRDFDGLLLHVNRDQFLVNRLLAGIRHAKAVLAVRHVAKLETAIAAHRDFGKRTAPMQVGERHLHVQQV